MRFTCRICGGFYEDDYERFAHHKNQCILNDPFLNDDNADGYDSEMVDP